MGILTDTNNYPSRTQTYLDNRETAGLVQPKESFFPDPNRVAAAMPSTNLRAKYGQEEAPPAEEAPPPQDAVGQPAPPVEQQQPVTTQQGGATPQPRVNMQEDMGQGRRPKGSMSRGIVEPVIAARNGQWVEDFVREELPPREANAFKMTAAKDLAILNKMLSRIKGNGRSAEIVGKRMIRRYMKAKSEKFKAGLTDLNENAPEGLFKASPTGTVSKIRAAYEAAMRDKLRKRSK